MKGSPRFARIKADILAIVEDLPPGALTTYRAVGAHLDVMPRHVAYILSTLEDQKKAMLPWHRVVGDDGKLGRPKFGADGRGQADLLADEGFIVRGNTVDEFCRHYREPVTFTAVPVQRREG